MEIKIGGRDWFDGSDACVEALGRGLAVEREDGEIDSDDLFDDSDE